MCVPSNASSTTTALPIVVAPGGTASSAAASYPAPMTITGFALPRTRATRGSDHVCPSTLSVELDLRHSIFGAAGSVTSKA
jgi:hypothetical protein